jgi:hypothetical protein
VIYRQKNRRRNNALSQIQIFKYTKGFFFHSTTILKPIHTHNEDGSWKQAQKSLLFLFHLGITKKALMDFILFFSLRDNKKKEYDKEIKKNKEFGRNVDSGANLFSLIF